jgi:hypothetical protein
MLVRIWRALFSGGRGDDYEKRLQHLSKEEADLLARMLRRTQFSHRGVRNLVLLSVLGEVPQLAYFLWALPLNSTVRMRVEDTQIFCTAYTVTASVCVLILQFACFTFVLPISNCYV